MSDIIDEIDALVDEQLSGYSERSGYDYNVNQDRCGHCHREWHGLKITERVESMAAQVTYDEDYRYVDDDSEVLCPGSGFIGPWATKRQIERMRSSELSYLNVGWIQHRGDPSVVQAMQRYAFPQRYVLGASLPSESNQSSPYVHWREPGDRGIESTSRTTPRIRNNPYARRPYQEPRQLVRGDVVVMTMAGERRYVGVIVDIVERDGRVEYTTEDPRYSARAQQLRDALAREQASAREAAIRGAEASQAIVDETRVFDDSQWSILTSRFRDPEPIPPELQFPREWPDFMGTLRRMLMSPNPFLAAEFFQHGPQPEPDTRTPQERALPRPSTTPPMWAVDAGRQRRAHTNSRRRHR